jgi:gliding motility-associated-like protein
MDVVKNPVKKYLNPGTYLVKLQAITDIGCVSDTTKPITMDKLDAKFSLSAPACESKAVTFTDLSTISITGNIVKREWDFGDGSKDLFVSKTDPTHVYGVGTYTASLTVESNTGCRNSFTLPVKINADPKVNFILPQVCLNDAFAQFTDSTFIADGSESSFTYQWNFGDPSSGTLNTSSVKNPKHKYNSVGLYNVTLTITSNNGCVGTITKPFTVNGSVPKANFIVLNNQGLCSNTNVQLQNTSTVDFGNITKVEIYWDLANTPAAFDIDDNPTTDKIYTHLYTNFQTPLSKTYQVKFRSYSGSVCVDEITKSITVNASPSVQFLSISDTCFNINSFAITQAGEIGGVPGIGVYSGKGILNGTNIFNPTVAGVGTHTIRYTFTSNTGCIDFKEQTITIYPIVNVNAGPDRTVLEEATITLEPIITGNPLQYLWTPNQYLNNNTIRNPTVSGIQDITYTLNVTGMGGCVFSDKVFVKVLKFPGIPNTFTPNGDGINETWVIQNLGDYPNVRVQVFNRYGQLVFESKGYTKPWNGTMNGNSLPFGTYYYVIEPGNDRKPVTGYVTLIK